MHKDVYWVTSLAVSVYWYGGSDRPVLGHRECHGGLGCADKSLSEGHDLLLHRLFGAGGHCGGRASHPTGYHHQYWTRDAFLQLSVGGLHRASVDAKFYPGTVSYRHRSLSPSENSYEVSSFLTA